MKVGDLVSVEVAYPIPGKYHTGIVLDLYDVDCDDGEAQILWDDGTILWEKIVSLQIEGKLHESR